MNNTPGARTHTALSATLGLATAALAISSLPMQAFAQSASPWLPIPGGGSISVSYVQQSGDSAYIGDRKLPIATITGGAAQRYKRETTTLKLAYGLTDSVAFDAAVAYGTVRAGAADNSSGVADSVIGVNWRVLDEFERRSLPTVTLRATGIINGAYNGARLAGLGKDANGYGLSLLIGRQFTPAFSLWGSASFEHRGENVPNASAYEVNAGYTVLPRLTLSAGYTNKKFGGNLDIGGPGFTPAAFQRVKEERETARAGVSFAVAKNQTVGLFAAKTLSGRNTVRDDQIYGLTYSFGF